MTVPSQSDLAAFGALVVSCQKDPIGAALCLYRYAKGLKLPNLSQTGNTDIEESFPEPTVRTLPPPANWSPGQSVGRYGIGGN